ncbi:MAG: histidine--tRNA ligase [Candidatus Lokiarchaeota archaeon]|nr:histidine--tRNA ligase [Candidatus Lokiarchaeota archaeon]
MSQDLRNLKGTRDLNVKEKLIQNFIVRAFTEEFEKFGYNPIETPIIEFQEILASKYAGGSEILKEMYTFQDNGKRNLALRYDLTVPLSRYVGMNPQLILPFKRYEFGKVFRDGPTKAGRYREFFQLDADVIGSNSLIYDAECLAIAAGAADKLGFDIYIELNSRKLLFGILRELGITSEELASQIVLSIDKLKKIGIKGVQDELGNKGIGVTTCEEIFKKINVKGTNQKKIQFFEENLIHPLALEGITEVRTILSFCKDMKIAKKVKFRPDLARGLEIYTGPIFEVFFKNSTITSSIAAGGRYDKIIGKFIDRGKDYPAVGISVGVDVILTEILQNPEKYPKIKQNESSIDVLLIPVKIAVEKMIPLMSLLRNANIKCDFSWDRNIRDSLGLASSLGVPICLILGKRELESKQVTLRNMRDETQTEIMISSVVNSVKKILDTV